jgi:hypothetical protein
MTALSSWTPPSANYAVAVAIGAGFRTLGSGSGLGLFLRAGGGSAWFGYAFYLIPGSTDTFQMQNWRGNSNTFSCGSQVGTTQNLASQLVTGDQFTVTVTNSAPPIFFVYRNGTQIYTVSDSGGCPAITGGGVALIISLGTGTTGTDFIRGIWAGAIASGPPPGTFNPSDFSKPAAMLSMM